MSPRVPPFVLLVLLAVAASAPASAQISTDRPGLGAGAAVVPRGAFQVEAGLPQATRINGPEVAGVSGNLTTFSFPLALRYGVTETVEFRASTSLYDVTRIAIDTPAGGDSDSDGDVGFDAVEVGAKIQLATNGPVVAIVPSIMIPTTESAQLAGAFRAVAGWTLTDRLGLSTVLGATVTDGEPDVQLAAEAVAGVSASLADAVSAYAEIAAYPQDGGTPVLTGAGILFLVSPDVQLDASFDVGLNDDAPDLLFGAGLSFRL